MKAQQSLHPTFWSQRHAILTHTSPHWSYTIHRCSAVTWCDILDRSPVQIIDVSGSITSTSCWLCVFGLRSVDVVVVAGCFERQLDEAKNVRLWWTPRDYDRPKTFDQIKRVGERNNRCCFVLWHTALYKSIHYKHQFILHNLPSITWIKLIEKVFCWLRRSECQIYLSI